MSGFKKNTKKLIHQNNKEKYVNFDVLDDYLNSGWELGHSEQYKIKKRGIATNPSGIAKTPEKEKLRRECISNTMKGNKNWQFNKTRGNGKKGYFNGIFCDSSWELAFVVFYIEHHLSYFGCAN